VPEIKYAVRNSRHVELVQLAREALAQETAAGVRAQLEQASRRLLSNA
jgi:hypothetical protein